MNSRPTPERRVAVLVDTATTWGRGIIAGIHEHAREAGGWHLFFEARGAEERLLLPRGWRGDGVIARVGDAALARHLRRRGLPVVNVSAITVANADFPRVTTDAEALAELACQHFLQRGFRHFAYLRLLGLEYAARQQEAFSAAVARAGFSCATRDVSIQSPFQSPAWNLDLGGLARWLRAQPRPLAILIWSGGREVIHACIQAGLRVPDDVALLSGTEDELLCETSPVPISGIRSDTNRIGRAAAQKLERFMRGERPPRAPIHLPPLGIVTRLSTDTIAVADRAVARAVAFIRERLGQPFRVTAVARAAGVSRSVLERRFAEALRTAPAAYITRARIERVKHLLATSDLGIEAVAEAAGFGSPEYMATAFRRHTGAAPLRFRREVRGR